MPKGMGYGEGMMKGGKPSRQDNNQSRGANKAMSPGDKMDGSFGKYPGSGKSDGGVMYDAGAGAACSNPGKNYNVTEGKARQFGTGGAMKG